MLLILGGRASIFQGAMAWVQVEVQRDPSLKGRAAGVVQYNPFGDLRTIKPEEPRIFNDSNGSLIAVGYEARAAGVKRCLSSIILLCKRYLHCATIPVQILHPAE